jgi:NAD(P)-dependent dehydrogenase (short-subunit alcohol dehydrogenase family)
VFAVNHLAPFLLTNLLLDVLKASAPARVVNVAGDFHRNATVCFDDLMCQEGYTAARANNQATLALILFTYELARRLEDTGVTANCLHPGATATDGPLHDKPAPARNVSSGAILPESEKGAETASTWHLARSQWPDRSLLHQKHPVRSC